jgi:hypothetical protein
MISFAPQFSGTAKIRTPIAPFLRQFKQRIEAGQLAGQPHWRWRYVVNEFSDDQLSFAAATFMTAVNIGLNRVTLRKAGPNQLEYEVSYRIWATYCVALGAALALIGFTLYFFVDMRAVIARQRILPEPGLNHAIGLAIYWGQSSGGVFCGRGCLLRYISHQ